MYDDEFKEMVAYRDADGFVRRRTADSGMRQCRTFADGPHTNSESGTCCDTSADTDTDTSAGTNAGTGTCTCTSANRPRPARSPR